ncbi:uncharacterized protein I206_104740 [Kwoniella pini CBS 10737]|uniref:Uncharacterized protein n=1 Tax=Kwoniella pini CBS 10737 TaxID=1296096 RepID=A0A1B9I7Q7_9TREE|nr:uncharacterized protein I206_02278 [Kwoniella pini CBS 10737]OCF51563.1 hypothetical protein I206_02278 [Kwoniella pini CBS 10737]
MLNSSVRLCKCCTKVFAQKPATFISHLPAIRSTPLSSLGPTSTNRNLRFSSSSSASPKRPSPYRLIQPHSFLSEFAPLHISGWRLDSVVEQNRLINPISNIDDAPRGGSEGGDLQDRRLIRVFLMGDGKEGWRDTMKFVAQVGKIVEQEDHHPTIRIMPSSDYIPSSTSLDISTQKIGYIVEISTHTHTPLPPYPISTKDKSQKMRPGITGKDIKLAERLEKAWKEVMGGKETIEMKKE